jgi:hypothetical protein
MSPSSGTHSDTVRRANALPLPVRYEPWPFNDVPGTPLVSPILEKIDDSPFVIADITYLNLNVVYEVGFTIGRRKRAFLVRHSGTDGDKEVGKAVGIFDTLGYHEYDDAEDLKNRLAAHIETMQLTFSTALDRNSGVYLIEPPTRGDDVVGPSPVACWNGAPSSLRNKANSPLSLLAFGSVAATGPAIDVEWPWRLLWIWRSSWRDRKSDRSIPVS